MAYFKLISISLSPNVEKDDVKLALNLLLRPWLWKKGRGIAEFEEEFRKYLGVKYVFTFNSGRSAFYALLSALRSYDEGLKAGDGVLLQAFTCNAVPNPILWAGLNPIYVDCSPDDFNIDIEDLKKKLTLRKAQGEATPRVLVVQHTFGQPANMSDLVKICNENKLILIEDCAHALGAKYAAASAQGFGEPRKMGTFGKAAFFSLGRDKVLSSVYGGVAVTNDDELGKKLEKLQKEFGKPSLCWTWQQIWHPVLLNYLILPIYNFIDLGKVFLILSQAFHVLSKAVSWQEKKGKMPDYFPRALPNALAIMALNQFSKLEKFNAKRQQLATFYYENLAGTKFKLPQKFPERQNIFLRFTVTHPKAHEILYQAWHKENILLGDWYTTPIAPFDTSLENMKYEKGMCPNAENLSKKTLNLPTHINISQKDAQRIINFLKKWN